MRRASASVASEAMIWYRIASLCLDCWLYMIFWALSWLLSVFSIRQDSCRWFWCGCKNPSDQADDASISKGSSLLPRRCMVSDCNSTLFDDSPFDGFHLSRRSSRWLPTNSKNNRPTISLLDLLRSLFDSRCRGTCLLAFTRKLVNFSCPHSVVRPSSEVDWTQKSKIQEQSAIM